MSIDDKTSAGSSNPNHQRWLAETWQMIKECAAATKGDRRRTVVTLSPEGCAALMAERLGNETFPQLTEAQANAIATDVVENVCELPDYNSPEDQPDLLQCTVTELHHSVMRAVEAFNSDRPALKASCAHDRQRLIDLGHRHCPNCREAL